MNSRGEVLVGLADPVAAAVEPGHGRVDRHRLGQRPGSRRCRGGVGSAFCAGHEVGRERTFWDAGRQWPRQAHVIRSRERPLGGGHPAHPPRHELGALLPQRLRRRRVLGHACDGRERRKGAAADPGRAPGWSVRRAGVEPGGGRGVQLAASRAETQPLEQPPDGVALTDRGHIAMVNPEMFEEVRNRRALRQALVRVCAAKGHTVGRMARPSGLLLVGVLGVAVLAGCASPGPTRSAAPAATYATSLADLQDKVDGSPRTAAPPGPPCRRTRTARGTWRRSATPRSRHRARRVRRPPRLRCRPPQSGWPTRWASSAARAAWPRPGWRARPRGPAATR